MDQGDLRAVRGRLLAVLWERLAELEADATREAIWRRGAWGDPIICPRCKQEASRFKDGVCFSCVADIWILADRKERLRQRFLRFAKAHNARVDKRNKRGPARAGPPGSP